MSDFRQAVIDAILEDLAFDSVKELRAYVSKNKQDDYFYGGILYAINAVQDLSPEQPSLYGYDIAHLAVIAAVMEKEGVTPEKAVQIFSDIQAVCQMVIDEIQERVAKAISSAQPDIIACGDCKHWICHDRRCGYWNHGVKPLEWCCHAERRTDE